MYNNNFDINIIFLNSYKGIINIYYYNIIFRIIICNAQTNIYLFYFYISLIIFIVLKHSFVFYCHLIIMIISDKIPIKIQTEKKYVNNYKHFTFHYTSYNAFSSPLSNFLMTVI